MTAQGCPATPARHRSESIPVCASMNLGAPELLIVVVLLGFVVLPLWGIIDAAMRAPRGDTVGR